VHFSTLRVEASDLSTFPDVSVVCGDPVMSSIDANALTNPTLLVEVTSRSTEDYDRGDKLSHYKQLTSLRVVLFVSHRTRSITCVERTASGWQEREFRAGEVVELDSPKVTFSVEEIYERIVLDVA
jgi:Uma2 family endonuclease